MIYQVLLAIAVLFYPVFVWQMMRDSKEIAEKDRLIDAINKTCDQLREENENLKKASMPREIKLTGPDYVRFTFDGGVTWHDIKIEKAAKDSPT
jgi:hypothetical protein